MSGLSAKRDAAFDARLELAYVVGQVVVQRAVMNGTEPIRAAVPPQELLSEQVHVLFALAQRR